MYNYALIIKYNGTDFHGWQKQPYLRTVQGELERVITSLLNVKIRLVGASRTDAGVHAAGQVANFICEEKINLSWFLKAVNDILPEDITVRNVRMVGLDFNARYSACFKEYEYRIINANKQSGFNKNCWYLKRKLDLNRMRIASKVFLGKKDFSFTGKNSKSKKDGICELKSISIKKTGDVIRLKFSGNRFLWKMVRIIAGTLVSAAVGKISLNELKKSVENSQLNPILRKPAPTNALVLNKISFEQPAK